MPRRREPGFIWIPPDRNTLWSCSIAGIEIHDYILSAKFPRGLIQEELVCEIELDNSGEVFTDVFTFRDIIQFKMDFVDGSTVQFEGEVEEILRDDGDGMFKLKIKGAHYTSQLLDVMVTEEYAGATISDIRKDLFDKYATDFTYTNVTTNATTTDITFVNKPLLDCLVQLDTLADEDTYIDNDKDMHTFTKSSKNNDNEAVVWNDSLISLEGLGQDSLEVRNRITVQGEAGGLPVLATSNDTASQTTYRAKEKVITDTSLDDEDKAVAVGTAENSLLNQPTEEGKSLCYFMPKLNPGDMIYVIYPPYKVHARFREVKYVFSVPNETTEVFFNQERSIPKLFKDRILAEQGQENIVNPYAMTQSYNFTFDNENKIDGPSSSNYLLSDSKVRKGDGETGIVISNAKTTPITVSQVQVQAVGEILDGATYWIQADSAASYQQVTIDALETITTTGTTLRLKIIISNAATRIDAVAVLYK
jgi:hypothetical protein|tara:strand:- start:513 stop:1943 length:1431 start_codon:yes stop_codon:yes gene_type:complete